MMPPASVDAGRPSTVMTMLVIGIAEVLWLTVTVELLFFVPGYERVFADFQVRVPLLTEWVISISQWCRLYFYVLVIPLTVVFVGVPLSTWWMRRQHRLLAAAWCIMMVLVPALGAAAIWLGCYLPFQSLMDALGPQNG